MSQVAEEPNLMALVVVGLVAVLTMAFLYYYMREAEARPKVQKVEEKKEEENKPKLFVCFGSQTGTAEQYSKQLSLQGKKAGYAVRIIDLEDFEPQDLEKEENLTLIFAMATYGEGEPTDNSHGFVRWVKNTVKAGEKPLTNSKFAVFGLGNTQYEHFNAMGKFVDLNLEKLGSSRFYELGLGDDDKDLDADFADWTTAMWNRLGPASSALNTVQSTEIDDAAAWTVALEGSTDFDAQVQKALDREGASSTKFYFSSQRLTVCENTQLRAAHANGSTRHIELWCDHDYYQTADNLAVLPENNDEDIEIVLRALGLDGKQRFVLVPPGDDNQAKAPFPTPCSIKLALKRYCDLTHKPKKSQLIALESIIHCDLIKNEDNFPTLVDAFQACPSFVQNGDSAEDRLSLFFDSIVPHLQPRYYTISSSSIADKGRVHVTASVVELAPSRSGVCSGFLASLRPGDKCAAFVRPSSFRMPKKLDKAVPLILVGPGTGLAPMRAILRERQKKEGPFYTGVSSLCLYFGCQRPDHDHIYKDEMDNWLSAGALDKLEVAYSRLPENNGTKVYVQHLMRRPEDAAYLKTNLLDNKGILFVCGATAMGRDVHDTLLDVFTTALNGDANKAQQHIAIMRDEGRYVQELWSA